MSFARFGSLGVLLGLAALAGALFLLHRLRVRHREHEVVTTMFWREAVEDVRARVLVRRFRHPWAYALMCAIAATLWLGSAGPTIETGDARDHVVLLDGSVRMGRGERFEEAREVVRELVGSLPRARTRVVLCGGTPRVLLLPGEDEVLLAARMRSAAPDLCPPTTSVVTRSVLDGPRAGPVTIHVIGDLPDAVPARADATVEVTAVDTPGTPNAGITGVGVTPARSGRRDRVDVFVETMSNVGDAPEAVLSVAGKSRILLPTAEPSVRRALELDVSVTDAFVTVQLPEHDAFAPDDFAGAAFPARTRVRVQVADEFRAVLAPVVAAAPDLLLVDGDADVVVSRDPENRGPAVLRIVSSGETDAVHAVVPGGVPAAAVLDDLVAALALDAIDATGLARRAGRAVSVGVEPGARRQLVVWEDFLREDGALHDARAFPVFVSGALRWLAEVSPSSAFVAVGERVPEIRHPMTDSSATRHDALGAAFEPTRADFYNADDGARVVATLASPYVTIGGVTAETGVRPASAGGRATSLVTLLGVLALVLLTAEWVLHRTGRMP